jgi:hypothetical protein
MRMVQPAAFAFVFPDGRQVTAASENSVIAELQ